MVARVNTVSFQGIEVRAVDVQVQLSNGLPAFNIVGYVSTILLLFLFFIFFQFNVAFAQDDGDWIRVVQSAQNEQDCQKLWSVVWSEAKEGNLQARFGLYSLFMPPPHMTEITFSGRTDMVSRLRDISVMAVHSTGVQHSENEDSITDVYYEGFNRFYEELNFSGIGGESFLKCLNESRSRSCAQIAVNDNLVPSFEAYAQEIDLLLEQGMKPICYFSRSNVSEDK